MADVVKESAKIINVPQIPQCQYFVVRKKRLCRMTVRPGRQYCGEHEPDPKTEDGQDDTRIPCPNDSKHTCYVSKLEKHLTICNARPMEQPAYIVHNINAPAAMEPCPRKPLSEIPKETLMQVIDKVNFLYDNHIKDNITTAPDQVIHHTVLDEFSESDRTESSRRHLRQASRLLWLVEEEGLVRDHTCYVELGAGKGQLSYYACTAWCAEEQRGSCALVVDRACLRHKRDNKLRTRAARRLRADLAHLQLAHAPSVAAAGAVVGLAKHLCGVATDYALRCITAESVLARTRGLVLATCCHHRCERASYVANEHLQELGINGAELNVMLGIVSWATCGDGRSRQLRKQTGPHHRDHPTDEHNGMRDTVDVTTNKLENAGNLSQESEYRRKMDSNDDTIKSVLPNQDSTAKGHTQMLSQEYREEVGRRAKALLDWGRVLYLREVGFDARLCYYVPTTVSLENMCIVASKV